MGTLLAILGAAVLAKGGQSAPAGDSDSFAAARHSVAGRMVTIEVTVATEAAGPDGKKAAEKARFSSPALVIGPRSVLALAPSLESHLGEKGAVLQALTGEGKGIRRTGARLLKSDHQTGLAVIEVEDLQGPTGTFNPAPVPAKNSPVLIVEPSAAGAPAFRRGRLLQNRAYLDQGRGKNPLLLVQLLDGDRPGLRSLSRWDDDLASGAGALLVDPQGGFLGIISPPALRGASPPGKEAATPRALQPAKEDEAKAAGIQLRDEEVLAIPAEVARIIADSLVLGQTPMRGYFGASFREVPDPPEDVRRAGSAKPAVRVEKVFPGGPADQGGLQAGDWLIAISEKKRVSYGDVIRFSELVEYGGTGKEVRLVVARRDPGGLKLYKLKIEIGWR